MDGRITRFLPSGSAGGAADDLIPEIAVAIAAPLVKLGAPETAERTAKQNCLLRIEEELGELPRFSCLETFDNERKLNAEGGP